MTTQEIKEIFKVDISEKNTNRAISTLKVIYVNNNLNIKTAIIAKELNITPQSVRRSVILYDTLKLKKGFEEMRMAFASKDKKMFDLAVAASVDSKEVTMAKNLILVKRTKKTDVFVSVIVSGGVKRVSEAMKKAGIKNHPLLNKRIKEYTQKDLNELIKIENETNNNKSNRAMVMR